MATAFSGRATPARIFASASFKSTTTIFSCSSSCICSSKPAGLMLVTGGVSVAIWGYCRITSWALAGRARKRLNEASQCVIIFISSVAVIVDKRIEYRGSVLAVHRDLGDGAWPVFCIVDEFPRHPWAAVIPVWPGQRLHPPVATDVARSYAVTVRCRHQTFADAANPDNTPPEDRAGRVAVAGCAPARGASESAGRKYPAGRCVRSPTVVAGYTNNASAENAPETWIGFPAVRWG